MSAIEPAVIDAQIDEFIQTCHYDPLRFVQHSYPWRRPGSFLEHHDGPDTWQEEFLVDVGRQAAARQFNGRDPVMPIRKAASKGHGVGGSVLVAWLVAWIMSTRPHAQGVVTANTATQLETKTWATVMRWMSCCLTGHWFVINSSRMYHPAFPKSWFCTPQTCRDENSEAFAGQHASDSTSFYLFDEDSAISQVIHEVSEGGMTDGEPMVFRFGNATRNNGPFYEACFGKDRDKWNPVIVDSRTSRFSNKAQIEEWIAEHGEDSDFVRVRVRGLPPRASDLQFIDQERVWQAQTRAAVAVFEDEPLIAGVDVSDGGSAWNVVRFRRGADGRSIPPMRIPGQMVRGDRSAFLAILAGLLSEKDPARRISMMFVDSAFGAPYVERLQAMGYTNVQEVRFGAEAPDAKTQKALGLDVHCVNMRAFMWSKMKLWLRTATIDPKDNRLESDLTAPGYHLNKADHLLLESKESMAKRNVASPDDADALALTFAAQVLKGADPYQPPPARGGSWQSS